ncbi:hypothetical protein DUNSADRAFT_4251 [Dunaliella salina]|uniref:Encoded protein n=1 Tax=Dunaliella salina TaxID=3046 RepID=A0ABQ7GSA6_DUNSA|nr:hypothetical protein DUNSADRAFT_4251 [Dunaliella salina]|eukprot:KAF5837504.1 hypothetical protein DUNSADRAFT_4251 [Dunaliella salina]
MPDFPGGGLRLACTEVQVLYVSWDIQTIEALWFVVVPYSHSVSMAALDSCNASPTPIARAHPAAPPNLL